jgi:hypothetical protein
MIFFHNIKNFDIFEPKVGSIMSHVIGFECLKILTRRNCAIYMFQ